MSVATGNVTAIASRNTYPKPVGGFQSTCDVEMAFRRWQAFRKGTEPLLAMAYFVLTVFTRNRSRKDAAKLYAVDVDVLNTLGDLSSARGDGLTARKIESGSALQSLTAQEADWVEQAVRMLIVRMAKQASGAPIDQLTLADLPPL